MRPSEDEEKRPRSRVVGVSCGGPCSVYHSITGGWVDRLAPEEVARRFMAGKLVCRRCGAAAAFLRIQEIVPSTQQRIDLGRWERPTS